MFSFQYSHLSIINFLLVECRHLLEFSAVSQMGSLTWLLCRSLCSNSHSCTADRSVHCCPDPPLGISCNSFWGLVIPGPISWRIPSSIPAENTASPKLWLLSVLHYMISGKTAAFLGWPSFLLKGNAHFPSCNDFWCSIWATPKYLIKASQERKFLSWLTLRDSSVIVTLLRALLKPIKKSFWSRDCCRELTFQATQSIQDDPVVWSPPQDHPSRSQIHLTLC